MLKEGLSSEIERSLSFDHIYQRFTFFYVLELEIQDIFIILVNIFILVFCFVLVSLECVRDKIFSRELSMCLGTGMSLSDVPNVYDWKNGKGVA